ncbi:hypothetical protein pb186bvf_004361 [Paramecium bursaria]
MTIKIPLCPTQCSNLTSPVLGHYIYGMNGCQVIHCFQEC